MKKPISELPCPFCQPEVRNYIFLENSGCFAIVNIAPVLPGHSLVIPSLHKTSFAALDQKEMQLFMTTTQTATQILLKAFNTDAFDWSVQEKPEAGQSIEHLHLHIVPRLKNDLKKPGDWYPLVHQNDEEIIDSLKRRKLHYDELKIIVNRLREIAGKLK